jgi:serine/threonine protein kinase
MIAPPFAATLGQATAFADELRRFRLISTDHLNELLVEFTGDSAADLAIFLVSRGELTPFQADRILSGAAKTLVLGPYRLLGPHRVGTFGPMFRADKGGKEFAVRVLPLRSLWQAKQAKQLVRTIANIPPHVVNVPLVDADSANGFHYLVWPLTDGEDLAERVNASGPLPPEALARLLARLAAGLAACHTRQVVHGLLTPYSIHLGSDDSPQLMEIGAGMLLANNLAAEESLFDTMSTSVAVAGAFDFAAPEWFLNPTKLTPAGDQYSLGAIGYFALTGTAPPAILGDDFSAPPELRSILERLLQADPAQRFSGMDEAREVLAELAGISTDSATDAPAPSNENTPRQSGARDDLPGTGIAWRAPVIATPADRDETDASIQFELPEHIPEEVAALEPKQFPQPPAAESFPVEPVETPRPEARPTPSRWSAATMTHRPAPPPSESPLLGPSKEPVKQKTKSTLPPLLPAAPLLPAVPESKPTGIWNGLASKLEAAFPRGEQPSSGWKKVKRKMLFWQTQGDTVQVSVFGAAEVAHSQTPKLTVFLHSPAALESVGTLVRAFHHDAILLGNLRIPMEITRSSRLEVHVAVEHLAVTNPLAGFTWQGQPHRLTYELLVPWEAPLGPALGVVSIGREGVRIGKVEFRVPILSKPSVG